MRDNISKYDSRFEAARAEGRATTDHYAIHLAEKLAEHEGTNMTSTYRDHVIRKVTDDKYVIDGWTGHSGYVTEAAARRGIDRATGVR